MAEGSKRQKKITYYDFTLVFILVVLIGFGLIMLYSASSYTASINKGDSAFFIKRQLVWSVLGLIGMVAISAVPYKFWEHFATIGYFVSLGLIPCVLFFAPINGARRWITIGKDLVTFQPAEVAKLAIILFFASYISKLGSYIKTKKGFWITVALAIPHCAFIYFITDNLSSAIIIFGIVMMMLFIACPDIKRIIYIVLAGSAAIGLFVLIVTKFTDKIGFRGERIRAWLDPAAYASGKGFQTIQGLYAIGSGGFWGKGLGQSIQKRFVPEPQNDMIFAIICEELGIFGAIIVIALFVALIMRLVIIANNTRDMFGALFVIGVIGHISIQVILNIAVVTNIMPNTGITLPFISYGGSAVIFQLMEIGVCLNVGKSIVLKDNQ